MSDILDYDLVGQAALIADEDVAMCESMFNTCPSLMSSFLLGEKK